MEPITNYLGIRLVQIPKGEFQMGIPDDGNAAELPEGVPVHTVNITEPILMSAHEVSIQQFQSVMRKSFRKVIQLDDMSHSIDFPITNMTWEDAVLFCSRLLTLGLIFARVEFSAFIAT